MMRVPRYEWTIVVILIWFLIIKRFHGSYADPLPVNGVNSPSKKAIEIKSRAKAAIPEESFKGWRKWEAKYHDCSSHKNPNLSPININTKNAIHWEQGPAIIVSSGGASPDDCLFLSSSLLETDLDFETVNIQISPVCRKYVTYIYREGEGHEDYHYFKRAIIYFTKSPVEPERSLHQIDGKRFDMEIEMEFTDLMGKNSTLIHVMVEALPKEQVSIDLLFKPLELAIPELQNETENPKATNETRVALIKRLEDDCLQAETEYFEALAKEDKEMNHSSTFSKQLDKLNEIYSDIAEAPGESFKELDEKMKSNEAAARNQAEPSNHVQTLKTIHAGVEKLKTMPEKGMDGVEDDLIEVPMKARKEEMEAETRFNENVQKLETSLENSQAAELKSEELSDLFLEHKVGLPVSDPLDAVGTAELEFENPEKLVEEIKSYSEKLESFGNTTVKYLDECSLLMEARQTPYNYVPIPAPFQISWLFPSSGGYYLYNGSRSIPKCGQVQHSIVFEKPIQITTKQLAAFYTIPSKFGTNLDQLIPVLREFENRTILYVKKGIYFEGQDEIHFPSLPKLATATFSLISENQSGKIEFQNSLHYICALAIILYTGN